MPFGAAAGAVHPGRAQAAPQRAPGTWPVIAAFAAGGAVALAGVAVGHLLGRRR